jgi:hypothetical protein
MQQVQAVAEVAVERITSMLVLVRVAAAVQALQAKFMSMVDRSYLLWQIMLLLKTVQ